MSDAVEEVYATILNRHLRAARARDRIAQQRWFKLAEAYESCFPEQCERHREKVAPTPAEVAEAEQIWTAIR